MISEFDGTAERPEDSGTGPIRGRATEPQPSTAASLFTGKLSIAAGLEQLRLRLLDLTGRNRLINFKHAPGKSLQFVHTSIDATFKRLTSEQGKHVAIEPLPEPARTEWVLRGNRHTKPEPREHAVSLGFDPSYLLRPMNSRLPTTPASGSQVRTLFYAEDLGKHCRKLEREAKLAIEETGANMLYLVMGFLSFPEAPDSEKLYLAPLLCLPVSLTHTDERQYSNFHLHYTSEEVADNMSLREKLKRDFGLNLPEYDAETEPSVETYLEQVREVIAAQPMWEVQSMMTLTLLSFRNMLLVRDLDPQNWPNVEGSSALLAHPLIRQVFEGRATAGGDQYATEYAVDDHARVHLPLILDADSSQHSALIDVLEGKNRVIVGPPGTGKSQTITNVIAASLQAGKKVLFIAEKLAALEVVKTRLTMAGLAPFVLELHSNKTSKKRVLEELDARLKMPAPGSPDLPALLEQQEAKRRELKAYADLVNTKVGNSLELTVQQVMWRAERHRLSCGGCAREVEDLSYGPAPYTSPGRFATLRDGLGYLADQLDPIGNYGPTHPLWGFFPAEFNPEGDLHVRRTLQEFATRFERFSNAASDATRLLGEAGADMSPKIAQHLLEVMANLAPGDPNEVTFAVLPLLFQASDPDGRTSIYVLNDLKDRQDRLTVRKRSANPSFA